MSIRFRCPFCQKPLKLVNNDKIGQPLQCPNPGCRKWIIFNDEGMPQQSAPVPPPPTGTRPQSPGDWVRVDEVDDNQVKKFKRPTAPAPVPPRSRGRFFDESRTEQLDPEPEAVSDVPPSLPPSYRNGDSDPDPRVPPPPRGGSRPAPPVPPRFSSRREPAVQRSNRGGGSKLLLLGLVVLGLVGAGVAAYFLLNREAEPVFVKKDYGIIELSTTSVKAIIARPYPVGDSYDFDIVKDFESVYNSAAKLQEDGKSFDPKTLDQAMSHVSAFYEKFKTEFNIPPERIAIIRSSGVVAGFKDVESLDSNRKLLTEKVRERTGAKLDALSPEDEGKYITRFVIPEKDLPVALLLDLGGGNIKGGLFDASMLYVGTDVPTGTNRFTSAVENAIKTNKADFQTTAKELSRTLVFDKVKEELSRTPMLAERKKVYLCGGITWVWRTYTRPNTPEQLVVEMAPADIDQLRALVADKTMDEIHAKLLGEAKDEEQRKYLERELGNIKKRFTIERIRAGVEILAAVSEAYEFPKKQLLFYSKGPAAPNMGYLLYKVGLFK